MKIVTNVQELQSEVRKAKASEQTVAFVPTMGYLHAGHASLMKIARTHASYVVASIFVNPTQFNDKKDFDAYPIDLVHDQKILEDQKVDLLFLPTKEVIYGADDNFQSWVSVDKLSLEWEGASRPGHFRGVSTVVSILFNCVQPDYAVFGEKDFQQLRIIEQMVHELKFPISIVRGPTIRETDGLAMSSRNVRLATAARTAALSISKGLLAAKSARLNGESNANRLTAIVGEALSRIDLIRKDYVCVVEESSLKEVTDTLEHGKEYRILVAVVVEGVRLIDNIAL